MSAEDKRDSGLAGHEEPSGEGVRGNDPAGGSTPEHVADDVLSGARASVEGNDRAGSDSVTPPVRDESVSRIRTGGAVRPDGGRRSVLSGMPIQGPLGIFIISALALVLVLGLYFLYDAVFSGSDKIQGGPGGQPSDVEMTTVRVFYPVEDRVMLEERQIALEEGDRGIAMASLKAFLEGPSEGVPSYVPDVVEINGVYIARDGNLYIDLTSAMVLNFQGDAVAEYLLLRSLYKTLSVNTEGIRGYRLLVDGREIDTVGGHIYIAEGLERAVSYRLLEEDEIAE